MHFSGPVWQAEGGLSVHADSKRSPQPASCDLQAHNLHYLDAWPSRRVLGGCRCWETSPTSGGCYGLGRLKDTLNLFQAEWQLEWKSREAPKFVLLCLMPAGSNVIGSNNQGKLASVMAPLG